LGAKTRAAQKDLCRHLLPAEQIEALGGKKSEANKEGVAVTVRSTMSNREEGGRPNSTIQKRKPWEEKGGPLAPCEERHGESLHFAKKYYGNLSPRKKKP